MYLCGILLIGYHIGGLTYAFSSPICGGSANLDNRRGIFADGTATDASTEIGADGQFKRGDTGSLHYYYHFGDVPGTAILVGNRSGTDVGMASPGIFGITPKDITVVSNLTGSQIDIIIGEEQVVKLPYAYREEEIVIRPLVDVSMPHLLNLKMLVI